ncbi:MAG: hypothetical protein GX973_07370 [Firmicutes bacterium]|nr:hypothetical protein [Bacillota bacterium]
MAKKYNRCRPQKRNIDRRKLEQYREELAREPGLESPEESSRREPYGKKSLHRFRRNPLI